MTPEELDRILSSEAHAGAVVSLRLECHGFVRREADQPAPLRFPWWRFAAGVAASGGMAVGGAVLLCSSECSLSRASRCSGDCLCFCDVAGRLGVAAVPRVLIR